MGKEKNIQNINISWSKGVMLSLLLVGFYLGLPQTILPAVGGSRRVPGRNA